MDDKVYLVTMSTRGRITIPAEFRKDLALSGGEMVKFKKRPDGSIAMTIVEPSKS